MANTPNDVLKMIEEKEIEWVDLRFTDPKGKWQHLTMVASVVGEDELADGFMFDGSSIEGWKAINESDMILRSEEHTSELQSLMRNSYAVFCLKKKKKTE